MKDLTKTYQAIPLNRGEIEEFELNTQSKLPLEFKKFIENYQDSKIKEILFFDENQELWILNAFLSFKESAELYKEFEKNLKRNMLPFAYDPGGWHFCLSLEEKDFGAIIVNRWTDHLPEEQFLKIANSFEEFIDGLQPEEEV